VDVGWMELVSGRRSDINHDDRRGKVPFLKPASLSGTMPCNAIPTIIFNCGNGILFCPTRGYY
jgi:hypothetical protein